MTHYAKTQLAYMFLDIAHHIIKIDYTSHIDWLGGGKIIDVDVML